MIYKYNPNSDEFEIFGTPYPHNNGIMGFFYDSDKNPVDWDSDEVYYGGFIPLASNHNIYLDDDTLFFWTPQMSQDSPHLYRLPVTRLVVTLLTVGGRTLGVVLAIFGIVSVALWVKRWVFSFLL